MSALGQNPVIPNRDRESGFLQKVMSASDAALLTLKGSFHWSST
jgi:hypothetical protein